jgi:hypothetical protein
VAAMLLSVELGVVIVRYLISAALWIATAISAVCGVVLFRSQPTPDQR